MIVFNMFTSKNQSILDTQESIKELSRSIYEHDVCKIKTHDCMDEHKLHVLHPVEVEKLKEIVFDLVHCSDVKEVRKNVETLFKILSIKTTKEITNESEH